MRKFLLALYAVSLLGAPTLAQGSDMQERLAAAKQAATMNRQALAKYTWQEQETVTVKGEVKKQTVYLVQLGPNGQPIKSSLTPPAPQAQEPRGRLRRRIVEKKKDEFKDYSQKVGALVQAYAHPDPAKMEQAFKQGNLSLGAAGTQGLELTFRNYLKQGDSFTLVLDSKDKSIQTVKLTSYLNDPGDQVSASAIFTKLPDGTSHVDNITVVGQKKQLQVQTRTSNYQRRM